MDIKISLATLSQLEAGKTYYLSNTTGTIKRTGIWQWFKCVTGLGDGRAKAQRLAEAVKESLLATAGISEDSALATDIKRFDGATYSLSGATLKDIAGRFRTAHSDAITKNDVRREAFKIAEKVADKKIKEWFDGAYVGVNSERPDESRNNLRRLALYSVQHIVQKAVDERKVPEGIESRIRMTMQAMINSVSTAEAMQQSHRNWGPGFPLVPNKRGTGFLRFDLDELHFRAVLAALVTAKGQVPVDAFISRFTCFQEKELQDHKDALLKIPLAPPSELGSGGKFAEPVMNAFKDGTPSAWEMLADSVSGVK